MPEEDAKSFGDLAKSLGDLLSAFDVFPRQWPCAVAAIMVAAAPPPPCSASRGVASRDAHPPTRQVQAARAAGAPRSNADLSCLAESWAEVEAVPEWQHD